MNDLGKYERCPICDKYGWTGKHICPPTWKVFEIDGTCVGHERRIYASDAEEAVAEYALLEDVESADYCFMRHGGKIADYRSDNPEQVTIFEITGEMIPQYTAEEIQDAAALKAAEAYIFEEGES